MTIYDTNVWVAYFNVADSQHAKAIKLFQGLGAHAVLTLPEYIILETATVLGIRASKQTADQFIDYALDNQNVSVLYADPELFRATVGTFQKLSGTALSFVDAALVALSRDYKVVTFDKALVKAIKTAKH